MPHLKRLAAVAAVAAFVSLGAAQTPPQPPGTWESAPAYVRLFAPRRAHAGAYRAYVSRADLASVLRQTQRAPTALHPPGAWTAVPQLPADAFGQTGSYDRWSLTRLYGARRALVARGPVGEGDQPDQAWTLISPYPSPGLDRLEPGTLLIILDLHRD